MWMTASNQGHGSKVYDDFLQFPNAIAVVAEVHRV
jgi:hypothetical protein